MDLGKFETQITKTGFVLEDRIAQQLKAAGWTVISNRYYVDDHEESVREIDLVAYRVTKVQHFNVYTSLLISCKKSESNAWAFLSRDIDVKDPNADWWPLHVWTNDRALQFEFGSAEIGRRYHEDLEALGVTEALRLPDVEVFAFQEMDRNTGAPQNDKPIFSAITSLMKAQSYEQTALPLRRKDPAIYLFHLLSVVDTDLVRLRFSGASIEATSIDSEHYIARYIVRKKETFSRIRFVKANHFGQCLDDYGRLHAANCKWVGEQCESFYRDVLSDAKRVAVFIDDFRRRVVWFLQWRIERQLNATLDLKNVSLEWRSAKDMPSITGPFSDPVGKFLNTDEKSLSHVASALKTLYRYSGRFNFDEEDDIPF